MPSAFLAQEVAIKDSALFISIACLISLINHNTQSSVHSVFFFVEYANLQTVAAKSSAQG